MDKLKSSVGENPEKTSSSTSLDRAFVLSCNESLLLNIASDNEITIDQSLAGESIDSKGITNADNGFTDSTSHLAFRDPYTQFNKSNIEGQTVCSETSVSGNVEQSCSRVSGGESGTEGSPQKVTDTTLSKVLVHMIKTILKSGSKQSKSTEQVPISDLSTDPYFEKLEYSNICHSEGKTKVCFSPSVQIEAPVHAINDGEDFNNVNSCSKLITILEGSDESASNLSNGSSINWSKMYLGKLPSSITSPNNITRNNIKRETYIKNDCNQNECVNDSTSSGIETSQSFETHDDYFDTIDSSICQYLEESGSDYTSASELSLSNERSGEVTNDIADNTLDHYSKQSITSKISEKMRHISFGFVKNGKPQTYFISSGIKSECQENQKAMSKSSKLCLTPLKKKAKSKKRLSKSSSDTASIHVTSYAESSKNDTCTPIRHTKYYTQPKTPQCAQSMKKNVTTTNRIWPNNSPRLSTWRSPVVVTSPIKPVKFLRNLFHDIEMKNRGLGKRPPIVKAKKIAKPMIFVTPASPL